MTANHTQNVLDDIDDLRRRLRDLEGSRAIGFAAYKTVSLSASAPLIVLPVPANATPGSLRVVWQGRSDVGTAQTYMLLRLNGDSGNNYLFQTNQTNNTTPGGGNSGVLNSAIEVGTLAAASATSGYLGSGAFDIPAPLGSTFKAPCGHSTSTESTTNSYSGTYGGLWLSTAAITSITLLPLAGNLVAGSWASLYGVN